MRVCDILNLRVPQGRGRYLVFWDERSSRLLVRSLELAKVAILERLLAQC